MHAVGFFFFCFTCFFYCCFSIDDNDDDNDNDNDDVTYGFVVPVSVWTRCCRHSDTMNQKLPALPKLLFVMYFQAILCLQGTVCVAEMPKFCKWNSCRPITRCEGRFALLQKNIFKAKSFGFLFVCLFLFPSSSDLFHRWVACSRKRLAMVETVNMDLFSNGILANNCWFSLVFLLDM